MKSQRIGDYFARYVWEIFLCSNRKAKKMCVLWNIWWCRYIAVTPLLWLHCQLVPLLTIIFISSGTWLKLIARDMRS